MFDEEVVHSLGVCWLCEEWLWEFDTVGCEEGLVLFGEFRDFLVVPDESFVKL